MSNQKKNSTHYKKLRAKLQNFPWKQIRLHKAQKYDQNLLHCISNLWFKLPILLYYRICIYPFYVLEYDTQYVWCGPGSSVGIALDYGLGGPGLNPGGDEIYRPVQTGSEAHPAFCTMGTGSFPGIKCGWGVLLTTHPLLVPRSWKSRAIPLPTFWATPDL